MSVFLFDQIPPIFLGSETTRQSPKVVIGITPFSTRINSWELEQETKSTVTAPTTMALHQRY